MIVQRTPEWYAARAGCVTGSRIDDALAGDKTAARKNFRTQLVMERLTGQPIDSSDRYVSGPMQWGIDKEPDARSWYCNKRDTLVTQLGFARHPDVPWVGCSPDSEVEEGVGGLEIKCPNTAQHISTLLRGTMAYKDQIQFQMWVMGWQWVDFVSFDPRMPAGLEGVIYRVPREDKYIDVMANEVKKFLAEVAEEVEQLNALRRAA